VGLVAAGLLLFLLPVAPRLFPLLGRQFDAAEQLAFAQLVIGLVAIPLAASIGCQRSVSSERRRPAKLRTGGHEI
jgi:hypothetical protein